MLLSWWCLFKIQEKKNCRASSLAVWICFEPTINPFRNSLDNNLNPVSLFHPLIWYISFQELAAEIFLSHLGPRLPLLFSVENSPLPTLTVESLHKQYCYCAYVILYGSIIWNSSSEDSKHCLGEACSANHNLRYFCIWQIHYPVKSENIIFFALKGLSSEICLAECGINQ